MQRFKHHVVCTLFFFLLVLLSENVFSSEGLSFKDSYLHPGKADYHYLHTKSTDEHNFIWWSPGFKGGGGVVDFTTASPTKYSGGYFRPLLPKDGRGELILGFLQVDTASTYSHEFQGEYRFPFGLGFGGGSVSRSDGGSDIEFGKITYRNQWSDWNYILETQFQETGPEESFGGYGAIYNDNLMLTFGNDGEQWRTAFGYVSTENGPLFRPVLEVLYVDNTIGVFDGSQFLFINATLKFKGGFLSHPARLGRAMGPTGVEYGNPLGFLRPTWNRRLDVWELGGLGDFRLVRNRTSSDVVTEKYEALVYPFQFDKKDNVLDHFYAGGFYSYASNAEEATGIMGGLFGKLGFLNAGVGADHNFETDETRISLGIIDKF